MINFFIVSIIVILLLIIVFYNKIICKAYETVNRIISGLDNQIESYRLVNVDENNVFFKKVVAERQKYYSYKLLLEKCLK